MTIKLKEKLDYLHYHNLFHNGERFKSFYTNETNKRFKKSSLWSKPFNKKGGMYLNDGKWHPFNRINTHPNVLRYFHELSMEMMPDLDINFDNPSDYESNIIKLWDFLDSNFELIFTNNITDIHIDKLNRLLANSWNNGSISLIVCVLYLYSIYPNCRIVYSFETGLINDMINGVDLIVYFDDIKNDTFQIKSGKYTFLGDYYIISGSQNNLNYNIDFYCYVDAGNRDNITSAIIFNRSDLIKKDEDGNLIVPKSLVKHKPINLYMDLPTNLRIAMQLCAKNDISFNIEDGYDNNEILYDGKNFIIKIKSLENENKTNELNSLLVEKIKVLENRLK